MTISKPLYEMQRKENRSQQGDRGQLRSALRASLRASYYHVWATIIKNDKPTLFGKAMRREDTSDKIAGSVFEDFRRNGSGRFIVVEAIERLIRETPCEWLILSYSSGGRATANELNEVMNDNGELVETIELDHKKNVMASMKWTNKWLRDAETPNREFLFLLKKGSLMLHSVSYLCVMNNSGTCSYSLSYKAPTAGDYCCAVGRCLDISKTPIEAWRSVSGVKDLFRAFGKDILKEEYRDIPVESWVDLQDLLNGLDYLENHFIEDSYKKPLTAVRICDIIYLYYEQNSSSTHSRRTRANH